MTESELMDPTSTLRRIIAGEDISRSEMRSMMGSFMDGALTEIEKAALLVALATKGETADEIAGAAEAMRDRYVPVKHSVVGVVDTCGTGGDGKGTFNISTAAALVTAAAGIPVAKHGNRSVSSRSGSADVLEALGVVPESAPDAAAEALETLGICFMFAPVFHPAMREVIPVRTALGVRTLFNVVGPLTNPAGAKRQVMGVYSKSLVEVIARVQRDLGAEHAMVVHGSDGLDELTTTGSTHVAEVRDGEIEIHDVTPEAFGLTAVAPEALLGGDPDENARLLEAVLGGEQGPLAEITAFNAGAAIYVGGKSESLHDGVNLALEVLLSGAAMQTLENLRAFSKDRAGEPGGGPGGKP
jgi:anthranilate phosphoribosyltransferase